MTSTDQPAGDPHDLLAGYLLDALDPDEADRFVAHLPACAPCRAELAELGPAVTDLADAHRVVPPAEVEERLMAQLFGAPSEDAADGDATATGAQPIDTPRRRRWVLPAAAAAAFVLGAGVVAGFTALRPDDQSAVVAAGAAEVSAVMHAPDAHSMPMTLPSGRASIIVSGDMDKAVVMGEDLPMPASGREYHVWMATDDGAVQSAGVFVPDDAGAVAMPLHGGVTGVTGFMLTVDAVGATEPSGPPIAEVHL